MLTLHVLPAKHGDCLVVNYGPNGEHHVLIDGGPANSYPTGLGEYLRANPDIRRFELMIMTHVDTDHIDGALVFLNDIRDGERSDVVIDEVWFNGWEQLNGKIDDRGAKQGDYLTLLLRQLERPLNRAFNGQAVYRDLANEVLLPGGARLTVLTPGKRELDRMRGEWQATSDAAGYEAGDVEEIGARLAKRKMYNPQQHRGEAGESTKRAGSDTSPPNGSSIGVLFEYGGKRLLLAGDAHARTMVESIRKYNARWGVNTMAIDVFKLAHHGSVANLTAELLGLVDCRNFVVSSNGDRFHHPDAECLALIADHARRLARIEPTTVYFNYAERMSSFTGLEQLHGHVQLEARNTIELT